MKASRQAGKQASRIQEAPLAGAEGLIILEEFIIYSIASKEATRKGFGICVEL